MSDPIAANAQRHQALLRELRETDYAPPTLAQMKACQDRTQAELNAEMKVIDDLRKNTKKELKDFQKIKDRTAKRLWVKVTNPSSHREVLSEREEKEEREYMEAYGKEQACEARIAAMKGQIDELIPQIRGLRTVAARHREVRDELNALYERVFKGPTPEYPSEDALEREANEAQKAYDEVQSKATAEQRAFALLSQASVLMQRASMSLQRALSASRVDMFGGGAMWDMMERSHLAEAQRAADQARMMVLQARQLQPAISDLAQLNMPTGHIMSDMFFDNIFTDYAFHQKIQAAASRTALVHRQLAGILVQSKQHYTMLEQEASRLGNILAEHRDKLRDIRRRIMEAAAASAGEGTWQAPPPTYQQAAATTADQPTQFAPPPGPPPPGAAPPA